jgi:hypothetical protein
MLKKQTSLRDWSFPADTSVFCFWVILEDPSLITSHFFLNHNIVCFNSLATMSEQNYFIFISCLLLKSFGAILAQPFFMFRSLSKSVSQQFYSCSVPIILSKQSINNIFNICVTFPHLDQFLQLPRWPDLLSSSILKSLNPWKTHCSLPMNSL